MTTKPTRGRPAKPVDANTFLGRVASRLRALRVKKGLTVDEAAEAITGAGVRVSKRMVYRWESAEQTPHVTELPAIAQAYNCQIASLFPKNPE